MSNWIRGLMILVCFFFKKEYMSPKGKKSGELPYGQHDVDQDKHLP